MKISINKKKFRKRKFNENEFDFINIYFILLNAPQHIKKKKKKISFYFNFY